MPVTPLEQFQLENSRDQQQELSLLREEAASVREQQQKNEIIDIVAGKKLVRDENNREYEPLEKNLDEYARYLQSKPGVGTTRYTQSATPDNYSREKVSVGADSLNFSKFTTGKYPFYKQQRDINTIIRPSVVPEKREPNKNKTGTYEGLMRKWKTIKEQYDNGGFYTKKGKIQNLPSVIQRATAGEAMQDRYVIVDPIKRGRYHSIEDVTKSQFGVALPKTWRSQENTRDTHLINRKFHDTEALELYTASNRGIYSQRMKSLVVGSERPYNQYQSSWWRNMFSNRRRIDIPIVHRDNIPWFYKSSSKPRETQTLRWGRRKPERFDNLADLNRYSQLSGTSLRSVYKVPFTGEHFKGGSELQHTYRGKDVRVRQRAMRNVQYDNNRRFNAGQTELPYDYVSTARRYHSNDSNNHFQSTHVYRTQETDGGKVFGVKNIPVFARDNFIHTVNSSIHSVPTRTYNRNRGMRQGLSGIINAIKNILPLNLPLNNRMYSTY